MNLKPGTTLRNGSYKIIETIGRGGFGITYRAEQVVAHRIVCIKEFFPKDYYKREDDTDDLSLLSQGQAEMMDRLKSKFIKEAQTIANLDHAHIIHIYDVFEENGTAYYVMEYIEGKSLNDIIKEQGALGEDIAERYIKNVASALSYIHDRKINHLDVKPGNIMVQDKDDSAILIDFGLSKHYNAAGDQTSSTPIGISAGYAPIEQYQLGGMSTFSPMTDIYALGATLYYLVTATVPPQATSIGERGLPELPAHLSDGMRQAISRAMQYWRKDRPQNIDEFLALLDDQTAAMAFIPMDRDRKSNSSPKSDEPKPKKQSRRIWLWILLIILLMIIGIVALSLGDKKSTTQNSPQNIDKPVETIKADSIVQDSTYYYGGIEEPTHMIEQDSIITPVQATPVLKLTSANDVTIKPEGEKKVKFKFEITNPISDAEIWYGTYEEWIEIEDIKIDQNSGDKISYIGYYTVPQNDSDKPRADNIVVTYCEQSFNIIVRQFPVATLTLSTNSINVSAEGGNEIINYSVGGTTKSVDVTQYYDWVKITHVGNGTIHLTIDPNPSSSPRNNTIKVTCGDIVKSIDVKQNGRTETPVLILKSDAIIAAPAGESIEIGYTIENPIPNMKITTSKPDDAWVAVTVSSSDNSIKLNVAENSTKGARDTKFDVYYNDVAYPVTVHQESDYVEVHITYRLANTRSKKELRLERRRCR